MHINLLFTIFNRLNDLSMLTNPKGSPSSLESQEIKKPKINTAVMRDAANFAAMSSETLAFTNEENLWKRKINILEEHLHFRPNVLVNYKITLEKYERPKYVIRQGARMRADKNLVEPEFELNTARAGIKGKKVDRDSDDDHDHGTDDSGDSDSDSDSEYGGDDDDHDSGDSGKYKYFDVSETADTAFGKMVKACEWMNYYYVLTLIYTNISASRKKFNHYTWFGYIEPYMFNIFFARELNLGEMKFLAKLYPEIWENEDIDEINYDKKKATGLLITIANDKDAEEYFRYVYSPERLIFDKGNIEFLKKHEIKKPLALLKKMGYKI